MCARCTGYTAGYITLIPLLHHPSLRAFYSLEIAYQLTLCALLAVPLALDWLTHVWKVRDSNNTFRLLTGTLLGIGVALLANSPVPTTTRYAVTVLLGTGILLPGLLGKWIYKQ